MGHNVYDSMGLCPPRDADPAPIIYAYVELNLQSMPDAPGVLSSLRAARETRDAQSADAAEGGADAADDRAYARDRAGGEFPRSACGASHAGTRARGASPAPEPQATKSPFVRLRATDAVEEERLCAASETIATTVETPELRRPKAQTPMHATTPAATMVGAGGDVEMTDAFRPPTPVSADLQIPPGEHLQENRREIHDGEGVGGTLRFLPGVPDGGHSTSSGAHIRRVSGVHQAWVGQGGGGARATGGGEEAATLSGRDPRQLSAQTIAFQSDAADERTAAEVYRERLIVMAAPRRPVARALYRRLHRRRRPAHFFANEWIASRPRRRGAPREAPREAPRRWGRAPDAQRRSKICRRAWSASREPAPPRQSDESSFSENEASTNDERADARTSARRDETHVCVFTRAP